MSKYPKANTPLHFCHRGFLLVIFLLFLKSLMGNNADIHAGEIDSLYFEALSDNIIDSSEARNLLNLLIMEEFADSSDLSPANSMLQQEMLIHGFLGEYLYEEGRFDLSHEASKRAVKLARNLGDSLSLSDYLSTQGCCEMRMADFNAAITSFEECISLAELKKDLSSLSSAYSNLASTYLAAALPENDYLIFAEKCIQKAIDIEEELSESPTLSIRYGIICEVYTKQGKYDEAIQMGQKAFTLDSIAGNKLRMARRLSQTGDALFAKHDMKNAEKHYLRSMHLLEEVGDPLSISINYKQLGDFFFSRGDRPKTLNYWMRGLELAEASGNNNLRLALLQKLYQYYRGYDDSQSILWLERYTALKDSLHTEQNNGFLNEYQERYKAAEREIIINRQQQEIRKRNLALILAFSLLVILTITTFLIYGLRNLRRKRIEAEKEVVELKHIISSQEKRVIDMLTHYVALHIDDKTLSNDEICRHLAVSQSTLNRQVNAIKGVSIQGFVQQMRMEKAERLLRTTKESISDIADRCGYEDVSYFTRVFKQCYGLPPTKFRASTQKGKVYSKVNQSYICIHPLFFIFPFH